MMVLGYILFLSFNCFRVKWMGLEINALADINYCVELS